MDRTRKFGRGVVVSVVGRASASVVEELAEASEEIGTGVVALVVVAGVVAAETEAVVPGLVEVDERPAGLVATEAVGQVAAVLATAEVVGQLVEEASSPAATEQVVGLAVVERVVGLATAGADPEAVEVSTAVVVVAAEVSEEAAEVFQKVQPSPIHFHPTPLGSVVALCQVSLESLSTK